jgi:hypothetical protein
LRESTAKWILAVLMGVRSKNMQLNGHECASADKVSANVRPESKRANDDAPVLHSGARLAAKLKATIIVNDTEFNHAGEMSVDDRHSYHEALESLFPAHIITSTTDASNTNHDEARPLRFVARLCGSVSSVAARVFRLKH